MAGKKKVAEPVKHQLKTAEIKTLVDRWQELEDEIAPLADELCSIKEQLVADLDVKDAISFGSLTLRIMQGSTRTGLQWKKVAMGLAKRLYPDVPSLRRWMRDLARKFPKKPTKPYARLFEVKADEEAA